ncbi:hypothetical protein GCM10010466_65950 [Planomonospora alba]|uniref:Bacterial transcriptional activator domain-containing protein n=1 Tax=Planomonospora alba TaxID=161354 RepID=A0ABP6P3A0_9ACTN
MRRASAVAARAARLTGALVVLAAVEAGLPVLLVRLAAPPPPERLPAWIAALVPTRVPSWEEVGEALAAPLPDGAPLALLAGSLWLLWAAFTVAVLAETAVAVRGVEIRTPPLGPVRVVAERLVGALAAVALPLDRPPAAVRAEPSTIMVAAADDSCPTAPMRRITLEKDATDPGGPPPAPRSSWPPVPVPPVRRPSPPVPVPQARTPSAGFPPGPVLRDADPDPPATAAGAPGDPAGPAPAGRAAPTRVRPAGAPSGSCGDAGAGGPEPAPGDPAAPGAAAREAAPRTGLAVETPSGGVVSLPFAAGVSTAHAAARLHRHRRRRILLRVQQTAPVQAPPEGPAPAGSGPEPEPAPVVRALRRAHLRTCADRGEGPPSDADLVRQAFSLRVPDRLLAGHRTDRSRVEVGLAGLNLGLTGAGAAPAARALVLDLLRQAGWFRAEVVIRTADLRELFGLSAREAESLAGAVPGLAVVESADAAVDRFTETHFARRRMLIERAATDVAELRERDPGEALPAVLLVAAVTEELFDWDVAGLLASSSRTGTGALLLGDWPSGTTCEIGPDGRVGAVEGPEAGNLLGGWLFHLPPDEARDCLRGFAVPDGDGLRGLAVPDGNGGRPAEEGADPDALPPWEGPEPVRLSILGRPVVQVKGRPEAVPLDGPALHLLVLLALHPDGVGSGEIRAALWPGASRDACVHAALRCLRDTLRAAADGADRGRRGSPFIREDGGVYRLDPVMVAVDLWDFEAVVEEARTAGDGRTRLGALDCAAQLCRGALAEGLACGWIDERRSAQTRLRTDVLAELAGLRAEDDPRAALGVLERAVALDPDPEELWRRLIRLQLELGRRDRAEETAARLRERLDAMGVRPTPETERLLAEL